ncbi:MAG: ABC transporter permease [Parachlamydiaceae bacterium]
MNPYQEDDWHPLNFSSQHFLPPPLFFKTGLWHRLYRHSLARAGVALLLPILFFLLMGPWLSGYEYDALHLAGKNHPPSFEFWFGTDDLGRDIFTRICYGGRISLFVGVVAALIDLAVGCFWGGVSGLLGGRLDDILMRLADILYSLPYLLIVILLSVVLGSGIFSLLIAITLTGWITMARIVRGQILMLKEMDYVIAAKTMGASALRLLFIHLLPNALGPILVTLTLTVPSAMFSEAFLSFLGLGIQAPQASLGTMANEGLTALEFYPWRFFFPACFISLILLSFHLIGEALKEILDEGGHQHETIA